MVNIVPMRAVGLPTFRLPSLDDLGDILPTSAVEGLSIYEDNKNIHVEAALPGINPEDVDISYDKGVLWIRGETKEEEQGGKRKYYRRASNSFSYRITLPAEVDMNVEPKASLDRGVLTVTFAKSPQAQPKKIQLQTSQGRKQMAAGKKTAKR